MNKHTRYYIAQRKRLTLTKRIVKVFLLLLFVGVLLYAGTNDFVNLAN